MAKATLRGAGDDVVTVPLREAWPLWMRADTAGRYLDFDNCSDPANAFRKWAAKHGVLPSGQRGDIPLWYRADLDRAVRVLEAGGAL